MTKALGFLTGVCLTVAMFVLSIKGWQHQQPDEESQAAIANGIQPANGASNAIDEASINPGRNPADLIFAAEEDVSETHGTPIAEVIKAATTQTGRRVSPLQPPINGNTERQNHAAGQSIVAQSPSAETHKTEVAAENLASPAPDQGRQQSTGNSDTARTHIFWSPFRSEWAAKGFARRLTDATQINIAVIETGRGRYRAAFDYQGESQRLEHMDRIESITGLQLE